MHHHKFTLKGNPAHLIQAARDTSPIVSVRKAIHRFIEGIWHGSLFAAASKSGKVDL